MKIKECSLCFKQIQDYTEYNIFKHNTLFKIKHPKDIWFCLTKHYICKDCMKKLQDYCYKGMFADNESLLDKN